jgi:hypothetical protein
MVSLMSPCLLEFVSAPKVLQLCTNQLVVWFVQVYVNDDLLITHPSPHPSPRPKVSTCPSTPKMLWTKERTPTPYPSIVFTLDSQLNLSRSLGVCQHCRISSLASCNVFYNLIFEEFFSLSLGKDFTTTISCSFC